MNQTRSNGGVIIALSLMVALLLTIMPLPEWARPYRLQWGVMVLIYWVMALPGRVGISVGFVTGLALDALKGDVLGQHALTFSVVAYLTWRLHRRVRVFPLWQQALVVLGLLTVERVLNIWIVGMLGLIGPDWTYWTVPLLGALLWPWVFIVLRDVRRRFDVR